MTTQRPRRRARRRILSALAALVIVGLLLTLGPYLWVRLASRGHITTVAEAPRTPVALVLGAGLRNGKPTPYLAYRLDVAVELWKAGKIKAVIVSGDNRTHGYDEPTAMADYLVQHGVPENRIVGDFAGRDTYGSCVRADKIFGVESLIVISQSYHLPRAVALCRAVGIDTTGVGDDKGRRYREVWARGQQREFPAAIKAASDVLLGGDVVLGPPESSVQDILARD